MERIVIKIGSSTLTAGTNELSHPQIVNLVSQIVDLKGEGFQPVLVSSGAMAAGLEILEYPELPKFIPAKQMLAAVGQPRLMNVYTKLFGIYDQNVAQVLLTREDLSNRRRYLNARNTLEALLAQGVLPIINENDTVATEEIRVGDNDNLSALVSNLIEADLLIMLTDKQGVFSADPDQDQQAVRSGTRVVITKGSIPNVILRVTAGEPLGTRFDPLVSNLESRKRFILAGPKSSGEITIDSGAEKTLKKGKSSLLPVGVIGVEGEFERGETVVILNKAGKEIALGLANYNAESMNLLIGHHSAEIEDLLGFSYGNELVHHDNMIVV